MSTEERVIESNERAITERPIAGTDPCQSYLLLPQMPCFNSSLKPRTSNMFRQFQQRYHLSIPTDQFLGLCAYLNALLIRGYTIRSADLDAFIYHYPDFATLLEDFELQQLRSEYLCIPSYHQWFHESVSLPVSEGAPLLNEEVLRSIWQEHPWTFVRAQHTVEHIAQQRKKDLQFGLV